VRVIYTPSFLPHYSTLHGDYESLTQLYFTKFNTSHHSVTIYANWQHFISLNLIQDSNNLDQNRFRFRFLTFNCNIWIETIGDANVVVVVVCTIIWLSGPSCILEYRLTDKYIRNTTIIIPQTNNKLLFVFIYKKLNRFSGGNWFGCWGVALDTSPIAFFQIVRLPILQLALECWIAYVRDLGRFFDL